MIECLAEEFRAEVEANFKVALAFRFETFILDVVCRTGRSYCFLPSYPSHPFISKKWLPLPPSLYQDFIKNKTLSRGFNLDWSQVNPELNPGMIAKLIALSSSPFLYSNKKSSAVKRILSEARELSQDTSTEYSAAPLEVSWASNFNLHLLPCCPFHTPNSTPLLPFPFSQDNIFEWHFTYRGPTDTPFSTGKYHGKIILPSEFPFRPPSVMILTPNGRWELNRKICLTFTGFHEEQWLPAWGVRTAILLVYGNVTEFTRRDILTTFS